MISKDFFAWCLFLPQSDGPYAKEDKLAEIPSESGNNHGDAVMCCWGRAVGEHLEFTICFSIGENKHSLSRLHQSLT